jgi:hypothetical protein
MNLQLGQSNSQLQFWDALCAFLVNLNADIKVQIIDNRMHNIFILPEIF